jgi:hypothetical protein
MLRRGAVAGYLELGLYSLYAPPLWGSAIYSPLSGHWLSECCLVLLLCTQGTYHYVVERVPLLLLVTHSGILHI